MLIPNCTRQELLLIREIARRAVKLADSMGTSITTLEMMMDLEYCHAHNVKLNLIGLLTAPTPDFAHDAFGIRRHMDRRTGRLDPDAAFLPRYAESCRLTAV